MIVVSYFDAETGAFATAMGVPTAQLDALFEIEPPETTP